MCESHIECNLKENFAQKLLLLKKSVGIQWRINGFSFYNFPTALEVEYHQPLTTFSRIINNDKITYGDRSKTYVKILFDF